jgi:transglutaminase superfamily protein
LPRSPAKDWSKPTARRAVPIRVRARLRRFRSLIDGPADLWLLCRMGTWAAVLPVLKRVVRLETLARIMWSGRETQSGVDAAKILSFSHLLTRRLPRSDERCYERSLLAYRFLSQRGADPRLVAAVKKEGNAIAGHAWVTVGGTALGESGAVTDFVPVVVFGRGGKRENKPVPQSSYAPRTTQIP